MKLARIISNNPYIYSYLNNVVIVKKRDTQRFKIHSYYSQIKESGVDNGKYMIKRFNVKYLDTRKKILRNKMYFSYADAGICFTYNRRGDVFYLNNKVIAKQLTKLLLQNSPDDLFILVNRKTGKETYFVSDSWYNAETNKNTLLLVN